MKKNSKQIITTSIQELFDFQKTNNIYTGEWCFSEKYKENKPLKNINFLDYHWDNRKKLYSDYKELNNLYNLIIPNISKKLNAIHSVNYSNRYWKILLGPWLFTFIPIIFDRWTMLKKSLVKDKENEKYIRTHKRYSGEFIPEGTMEFLEMLQREDWNDYIFSEIFSMMNGKVFFLEKSYRSKKNKLFSHNIVHIFIKNIIRKVLLIVLKIFPSKQNLVIYENGLPKWANIFIKLGHRQIPVILIKPNIKKTSFSDDWRKWKLDINKENISEIDLSNQFLEILSILIPKNLPKAFLEGFSKYGSLIDKARWPNCPKYILTAKGHDDFFKHWCAKNVESGSKLIWMQHGGNYGLNLFSSYETYEIDIADKYITWGWTSEKFLSKIIPFKITKNLINKKIQPNKNGKILLCLTTVPKFSYHLYSAIISYGQWKSYIEDVTLFLKKLNYKISKNTYVRVDPTDRSLSQKNMIYKLFPKAKFDNRKTTFQKVLSQYSIFIGTYNATTFLETLSFNFPTILFWNKEHWELREEAEKAFTLLEEVGIFHQNVEQATNFLELIYPNIEQWWFSKNTQNNIKKFCNVYCSNKKSILYLNKKIQSL